MHLNVSRDTHPVLFRRRVLHQFGHAIGLYHEYEVCLTLHVFSVQLVILQIRIMILDSHDKFISLTGTIIYILRATERTNSDNHVPINL